MLFRSRRTREIGYRPTSRGLAMVDHIGLCAAAGRGADLRLKAPYGN